MNNFKAYITVLDTSILEIKLFHTNTPWLVTCRTTQ